MNASFVKSAVVISGASIGSGYLAVEFLLGRFGVFTDVALVDGILDAVGRVLGGEEDILVVVEETGLDSIVGLEITGGVIRWTNRAADHIAGLGRVAKIGVS